MSKMINRGTPIGEIIRTSRVSRGWTLPELASKASVSKGLISKLENNSNANPTLGTIQKISHAFGYSVSYMLEDFS